MSGYFTGIYHKSTEPWYLPVIMTLQNSSSWHVISLKIVISVKKYFIFAIIERIFSIWVFQWIIMASVQDPNSLRSLRVDPMWTRPHRKFQKNRIFSNRTKIRGLESRSKITSQGSISKSTRSCPVEIGHFGTSFIGSWFIPIFLVRMSEIDSDLLERISNLRIILNFFLGKNYKIFRQKCYHRRIWIKNRLF